MTRGKPVLDPEKHLKGATPEALARRLFRRVVPLRPGARRKPVVRDEGPVAEAAPDEPGNGVAHLEEGS